MENSERCSQEGVVGIEYSCVYEGIDYPLSNNVKRIAKGSGNDTGKFASIAA